MDHTVFANKTLMERFGHVPYSSLVPADHAFTQMIGCDNGTDCPYQWVPGFSAPMEVILTMLPVPPALCERCKTSPSYLVL